LAKKQKKATPERAPTKHQLSKWQRQMRIRRIVIIAAVVFLVGISSWVGYGYYSDYRASTAAWRQVVIEVNGVKFDMEYFVKTLDALSAGMNSSTLSSYGSYFANMVADSVIDGELLRQGAPSLNITVSTAEIDARLKQYGSDERYRDMVTAVLLEEKLRDHFGAGLNGTQIQQAHIQVMLVESQEVAANLTAEIEAGGNFTALAKQYSLNSSIEGDLGWLPLELIPNSLIANAAFNLTPPALSQPIYDETAVKKLGYWLIEVTGAQNQTINALVMLLPSKAQAEQVKAQLAAGANFSALAANYSQHKSKANGGKLDGLKRGNMTSTAFDAVAFNLTLNTVSEPVRDTSVYTTGGYWLVMVMDSGERVLEEQTLEQLIDKRFNDWREVWTNNSTIETYLDANKLSWAVNKVLEGR
jgi:peptidyl-prolyl cis-trans isomerase C